MAATRWKFYDPALLWLFPGSYALHLLEEWAVDAPIALWHVHLVRPIDAWAFVLPNLFGLALMSVGVRLVGRNPRYDWIAPALATAVLLNTAGHFVGSIVTGHYSAGLTTGVVFWIPLGLLTLIRVASQSTPKTLWGSAVVGVAIELVVVAVLATIARQ